VIVVSHDRWFLDRVATRIVHLDGKGHVRVHEGDLSMLLEKLAAEKAAAESARRAGVVADAAKAGRAVTQTAGPKPRKLSTKELRELEELPSRIEAAEQELAGIDARLGDPSLYAKAATSDFDELSKQRKALSYAIEKLYARWEELETIAEANRTARG